MPRLHVAITQHRGPAENRVEWCAQFVRERREELVLQPVGRFRVLPGVGECFQQIAQFVLTLASSLGAPNQAEGRAEADRALEQNDVAQPLQKPERASINLRALGVSKQQNRDVRPCGLRPEAFQPLRHAAMAEIRTARDHDAGWLAAGVRVDHLDLHLSGQPMRPEPGESRSRGE